MTSQKAPPCCSFLVGFLPARSLRCTWAHRAKPFHGLGELAQAPAPFEVHSSRWGSPPGCLTRINPQFGWATSCCVLVAASFGLASGSASPLRWKTRPHLSCGRPRRSSTFFGSHKSASIPQSSACGGSRGASLLRSWRPGSLWTRSPPVAVSVARGDFAGAQATNMYAFRAVLLAVLFGLRWPSLTPHPSANALSRVLKIQVLLSVLRGFQSSWATRRTS